MKTVPLSRLTCLVLEALPESSSEKSLSGPQLATELGTAMDTIVDHLLHLENNDLIEEVAPYRPEPGADQTYAWRRTREGDEVVDELRKPAAEEKPFGRETVLLPLEVVQLIDRAFVPRYPRHLRNADSSVISAALVFRHLVEAATRRVAAAKGEPAPTEIEVDFNRPDLGVHWRRVEMEHSQTAVRIPCPALPKVYGCRSTGHLIVTEAGFTFLGETPLSAYNKFVDHLSECTNSGGSDRIAHCWHITRKPL